MKRKIAEILSESVFTGRARVGMETLGAQSSVPLEGVINMGSGTPDFPTPSHILEAAQNALVQGYTKYAPWQGYPELREAISRKLAVENNVKYDPENEILVTTGTQEALAVTFLALLETGDEVIVPSPYYNEYTRWIALCGASLVAVPTQQQNNYIVDPEDVKRRITSRTKMIALTTPNNPTGTVLPKDVLEDIAQIALKNNLVVLSDELYDRFVYEPFEHFSIASLPDMADRTIVVNGFSKTFAMTGFRIGYLAAPAPFIRGMLPIKHSLTICAPAVAQRAALAALTGPRDWWDQVFQRCVRRRKMWLETLDELELPYGLPMGSYVFLVDVSPLGMTGDEFSRRLLTEERVLVGPGHAYGAEARFCVRVSLMVGEEELEEGLERIKRFVKREGARAR